MADFPFDIVGFDLDGTLLDTHPDLAAALNHALATGGYEPVPVEEVRALVGGGSGRMLGKALQLRTGRVGDEEFRRLHRALLDYYEANVSTYSALFPGGEAMLDDLAVRGVKLAVVTNKLEHFARALLDDLDLSRRFFTILGGDSLGRERAKPAPDLLLEMQRLGGGGRCAYVGDTTYDTGAAKAAGFPCVTVSFGYVDAPASELGGDMSIDHFDELIPALENLD